MNPKSTRQLFFSGLVAALLPLAFVGTPIGDAQEGTSAAPFNQLYLTITSIMI